MSLPLYTIVVHPTLHVPMRFFSADWDWLCNRCGQVTHHHAVAVVTWFGHGQDGYVHGCNCPEAHDTTCLCSGPSAAVPDQDVERE